MSKIDSKATNRPQHLNLLKEAKAKMYILSSYHWHDNAGLGSANKGRLLEPERALAELGTVPCCCRNLHIHRAPLWALAVIAPFPPIQEQLLPIELPEETGEPFWLGLVHYRASHVPSDVCTSSSWRQNCISRICGTDPSTAWLYLLDMSHLGAGGEEGERGWLGMLSPRGSPHCYDPH